MIPEFDDNGYLPPGIHPAALDEIAKRFGIENELRQAEMESLRWLVDLAKRIGVLRIVVDGSFVTEAYEPNDVDCALLVKSDVNLNTEAGAEFGEGLPFIQASLLEQSAFDYYVGVLYASDRDEVPKGMVEVKL